MHICVIYEVTSINHSNRCTVHIFNRSQIKYVWHITNTAHMVYMLNWHADPVFCIYMLKQPTATSTSCYYQLCARNKYTYETGHIWEMLDMYTLEMKAHIYARHEVNVTNH